MINRILHCGLSTENYNKCLDNRVAGFRGSIPTEGDVIYLVVKVGALSLCGARGVLGELIIAKPWKDASSYPNTRVLNQMEYCEPFDASILRYGWGQTLVSKIFPIFEGN